jgi:hypothetical protein
MLLLQLNLPFGTGLEQPGKIVDLCDVGVVRVVVGVGGAGADERDVGGGEGRLFGEFAEGAGEGGAVVEGGWVVQLAGDEGVFASVRLIKLGW